jgi:hypothetical protein
MHGPCSKAHHLGFDCCEMCVAGDALDQRRLAEADRLRYLPRLRDVRGLEHMDCTVSLRALAECRRQAERGFIAEQDNRRFKAGQIGAG